MTRARRGAVAARRAALARTGLAALARTGLAALARTGLVVLALAPALAPAGCDLGEVGTVSIGLTTAPGSTVMDRVTRLRLTFTAPPQVIVIDRTERGFDLSLDLPAADALASLSIEGLDAGGALAATGATPPYALDATDARLVVYMAPPMSIGPAPAALAPARTRPSAAAFGYGVVLAGGVDGAGAPSDALQIYDSRDHSLTTDRPMPDGRVGAALGALSRSGVYLFGGEGPGGAVTGTLWFFDTTTSPESFVELRERPELARAGAAAIPIGGDSFLLTGAPPLQLGAGQLAETAQIPALSGGASVLASDRSVATIAVDQATGDLISIRTGAVESLGAQRKGAAAVALPGGRVAVIGGEAAPRDAIIVDATSGELLPVPGALAEAYESIAVAATPRFVVVAGRRPGAADTEVEILDAATLAHRHTASVADAITTVIALPNGQVLLIGAALQLFTPPPPDA